jgi:CRISPR/Cas system-associated exonuclease Cas4 (RecB family)
MVELENTFFKFNSWSFTKHRIWNRCRRQYYYEYIAPYLKPPTPVDVNKIRLLKTYNSRYVLQGQIIHEIIDNQIKLHCDKKPMDPAGALSTYSRRIAQNKIMADEMFTEYRNGDQVDEQFFTTIDESGRACLNMFFGNIWPGYNDQECLRHEEFDKFRIGDIDVTVKVDFVGRMKNGTIILTDWKTGSDNDEYETELQMAAYVIWAVQYYQKSPDNIKSELVFLKTGEKKPYFFIDERLHEATETIKTDFEAMNATYEYDDYPPSPHLRECLSCRFARICSEANRDNICNW